MNKQQIIDYIRSMDTKALRDFENEYQKSRWADAGLPADTFWPVFAPIPSKRKGDIWEEMYVDHCVSLTERVDRWHDATLSLPAENYEQQVANGFKGLPTSRIEIKYTAIAHGDSNDEQSVRGYAEELSNRVKIIDPKTVKTQKQAGGSFQQIHPDNAHYGLFSAVYGNGAVHYWVPYHLISKTAGKQNLQEGKILLSSQHHGGTVEGQINLTKRFHELFFLDYTVDTLFITDLSKYNLAKYETIVV